MQLKLRLFFASEEKLNYQTRYELFLRIKGFLKSMKKMIQTF